jgi:arylsulfatase A-like enzyme
MNRPNIVLIMTDQQRADHVGWHPQSRLATPNIDWIGQGAAFLNCITSNPICTPARTALLTGKYSHQVGTLAMSGDLSRQHPTYARALQQAGYYTAGIGKFHWLQTWKWGRERGKGVDLAGLNDELKDYGFDTVWEATGKQLAQRNYCDWCAHLDRKGLLEAYRDHAFGRGENYGTAEQTEFTGEAWPFPEEDYVDIVTGDRVVQAIDERPSDKPFFIFASFCSPHAPYDPPQRYLDAVPYEEEDNFVTGDAPMSPETKQRLYRLRRAYKAMINVVDDQVGRILERLEAQGVLDNTIVMFTTDHGEMMGDHGFFQKSRHWWQSATVPTAIRHPAHVTGARHTGICELTDLTATILDAAGLDPRAALSKDWPKFHDRVPCRSLLPVICGETDAVRDYAFCECDGRWSMIQNEEWKYVRLHGADDDPDQPHEELYHLATDPDEQRNLAGAAEHADMLEWGRRRLVHVLTATPPAQTTWAPLIE